MWGQGKPKESLSPEELEMRELWEQVRTTVLNLGNNQLRAAQNEIANHIVSWKRYTVELKVKPEENDNGEEA